MSLAALKKKVKQTKNIKIGFKKRINPSYTSNTINYDYEMKPPISYYNLMKNYNNYKNSSFEGDCNVNVAIEPDLSGKHHTEVLSTQHLKKENIEKMKHIKREPDDKCNKKNELNYKDDDMSKTAMSAQFVMNKKKAKLIDNSCLTEEIVNKTKNLFFIIKGTGSIITGAEVEISVITHESDGTIKPFVLLTNDENGNKIVTDLQGEAVINIVPNSDDNYLLKETQHGENFLNHDVINSNANNRVIITLKPTENSRDVDTSLVENIIIKREYQATLKLRSISDISRETITSNIALSAEPTVENLIKVNPVTTMISKLTTKNQDNPSYQADSDMAILLGVDSSKIDIGLIPNENGGGTFGQTFNVDSDISNTVNNSITVVDQMEKWSASQEEEIDIMEDIIVNVLENNIPVSDISSSHISENIQLESQNTLLEITRVVNDVYDSSMTDENIQLSLELLTIANQDGYLVEQLQDEFNSDTILNTDENDAITDIIPNIPSILDVSNNIINLIDISSNEVSVSTNT